MPAPPIRVDRRSLPTLRQLKANLLLILPDDI